MTSAAVSSGVVSHILPASLQSLPMPHLDAAALLWSMAMTTSLSLVLQHAIRRSGILLKSQPQQNPVESTPDDMARACLLTVSTKESGLWLKALPFSSWV